MQSNHTAPDTDARDILLDVFLNGEPEECRTLHTGNPGFFGAPKETIQNNALPAADQQFGAFCRTVPGGSNASIPCLTQSHDIHSRYDGRGENRESEFHYEYKRSARIAVE